MALIGVKSNLMIFKRTGLETRFQHIKTYICQSLWGRDILKNRLRFGWFVGSFYLCCVGYLRPATQIHVSFAVLKPCLQAGSFEYNNIEFEDETNLTPRRAMSDLNGKIWESSSQQ
jgi:hypothetical protein